MQQRATVRFLLNVSSRLCNFLPEWNILDVEINVHDEAKDLASGYAMSAFTLRMKLRRKYGFYIIVYHIPAFAIAVLAVIGTFWAFFCIKHKRTF